MHVSSNIITQTVARFTAISDIEADPSSELILFTYVQPFANHNGGCVFFGKNLCPKFFFL